MYIVQKHAASRLHYDFRLELDGTLKSWAVPKGPSVDPKAKRLAVHVEDHPVEYGSFEGTIPKGEYGGGTVMLWDRGTWEPLGDARKGYRDGKLKFRLQGERLHGLWTLVRMSGRASADGKNWLLIKERDEAAEGREPVASEDVSVKTGRSMDAIGRRDKVASLRSAHKARIPATFAPQLATPATEIPGGDGWIHEIKLDGYRILAFVTKGRARLVSRNGKDWTDRFASIADALVKLPLKNSVLDGEVVALRPDGRSDFQMLQNAMRRPDGVELRYFVFDLPFHEGKDLRGLPLIERKRALEKVLPQHAGGIVRLGGHVRGNGEDMYREACRLGCEGIVSKRADSPYESKRAPSWLKIKCSGRQELLVAGWTDPQGARSGFGSLVLAYHDRDDRLVYAGRVGTGFDAKLLAELSRRMAKLGTTRAPFAALPPPSEVRGAHWVKPKIVVEVTFTEWTKDGRLRHPSFVGIREDKDAGDVVREPAAPTTPSSEPRRAHLTHPDRMFWPEAKITKEGLARYYEGVADLILPHLVGRPLAIVRCPEGRTGECFFQKHASSKSADHLTIRDLDGLYGLVQMGALEIHPWGATTKQPDRPDRIVFDLDPGPGLRWFMVIEAAREVQARLAGFGMTGFVRTSGGKGLHVVVPLSRRASWDDVKLFARELANDLVRREPERYVATMSKSRRTKRIFVDWLRNGKGATAIASYSTRAREGAPVATPLRWDELGELRSGDAFDVASMPARIAAVGDAWPEFFSLRQTIPATALRELARGGAKARGA